MPNPTLDESLKNIQGQIQGMFSKIQSEGITDKAGNVLLQAGSLKDVPSLNVSPTGVPDTTKDSLESLKTQATTALASATSQDEFFKAQQELFKQQQEELSKQKEEQKGFIDKAKEFITGRDSLSETLKAEQEKLGIPVMWDSVKALIPEIGSLQAQLAQLQTAEATEVTNIQQNPQYSVQFASREAQRVSRDYAIKQSGISAELGAKTALMQAFQGNITAARNMVSDIVSAMKYDTDQKFQDIKFFVDNNQSFIDGLDKSQQAILTNIESYWETKSKNEGADYKSKLDMIIDAANKGVNLGIGIPDVKKMSLEDVVRLYQSKVSVSVAAENAKKEGLETGGLTLFDDILQSAIDIGASPSGAAQAAVLFAEQQGISLTEKERATLINKAKEMKPTTKAEPTPEPTITPKQKQEQFKQAGKSVKETVLNAPTKAGEWVDQQFGEIKSFFGGLFGR